MMKLDMCTASRMLLALCLGCLLSCALPTAAKGSVEELGDAAAAAAALARGTWMVLIDGGTSCSRCWAARTVLASLAHEFRGKISMAVAAQGTLTLRQAPGTLVLFPGQGAQRFVEYTDPAAEANVRHFLWFYLADTEMSHDRFEEAVKAYAKALDAKSVPEVHGKLAGVLHQRLRDLPKAVIHYDEALKGSDRLSNEWHIRYLAGNAYLTLGFQEKALGHYVRAAEMNPTFASAHREAAIAATLLGNRVLAEQHLRKAIARNAKDVDSHTELAALLLDKTLEVAATGVQSVSGGEDGGIAAEGGGGGGKKKKKKKKKKQKQEQQEQKHAHKQKAEGVLGVAEGEVGVGVRDGAEKRAVKALLQEADGLLEVAVREGGTSEALYYRGLLYKIRGARALAQRAFGAAFAARDTALGRPSPAVDPPPADGTGGLKIFVYDLPSRWNAGLLALNMVQCRQSIYASEVYIHEQLLLSPSLTLDAREADLFFIPVYASCLMSSTFVKPGPGWPDNDVDVGKTFAEVEAVFAYLARLRVVSSGGGGDAEGDEPWRAGAPETSMVSYYNRSRGADHVVVMSSDWGACQGPLDAMHNVIVIATSGDRSAPRPEWYINRAADHMGASAAFAARARRPCFQMHKDIAVPPMIPVPALIQSYQGVRGKTRDIQVYFRGTTAGSDKAIPYNANYSLGVRQYIVEHFSAVEGWLISAKSDPQAYHSELLRSTMCIAPAGWELWSVRFFESMLLGCIPVIVTDDIQLPFQSQIDYSAFTVKVAEADVPRLPEVLAQVSPAGIRRKQDALRRVWKTVTYQTPPSQGDAFHHLMAELQARVDAGLRHTPMGSWL